MNFKFFLSVIISVTLLSAFCFSACGDDDDKTDDDDSNVDDDDDNDTQGEYDQGVYHCCAPGQGTDCCDGYEQGMCFKYGGIYEDCRKQGEEYEAKVICAICCEGLQGVEEMKVTDEVFDDYPEGCGPSDAPFSKRICINCGDGECLEGENACNCPDDCE